jgi:hypothetical protein
MNNKHKKARYTSNIELIYLQAINKLYKLYILYVFINKMDML